MQKSRARHREIECSNPSVTQAQVAFATLASVFVLQFFFLLKTSIWSLCLAFILSLDTEPYYILVVSYIDVQSFLLAIVFKPPAQLVCLNFSP